MADYSSNPKNWICREVIDNCLAHNEHVDGIDVYFNSEPIGLSSKIMLVIPESYKKKSVLFDYGAGKITAREHSHKVLRKERQEIWDYPVKVKTLNEREVDDFTRNMEKWMPAAFGSSGDGEDYHGPKIGLDGLQSLLLRNGKAAASIVDLILQTR